MIWYGGKGHYIGTFDTPEEASAARVSVKKDLNNANLSVVGDDEVVTIFEAAKKRTLEAVGLSTFVRDLPTGVQKTSSGKFGSQIWWGGKMRQIGTFDTLEQTSVAFMSVKKDLADAKLSAIGADEVDVIFGAAKKKALESVGGFVARNLPRGVTKLPSRTFATQIYWGGKKLYIGTFGTPEQASAARMSVKNDLDAVKLSELTADEADAVFGAAKTKALNAVLFGYKIQGKEDKAKASSQQDLPESVRKAYFQPTAAFAISKKTKMNKTNLLLYCHRLKSSEPG